MRKRNLQQKLLQAFSVVIAIFVVATAGAFLLNSYTVRQYKAVSNNMIAEYHLTTAVSQLITAYNERFFLHGSTSKSSTDKEIANIKANIRTLTNYLDTSITSTEAKTDFAGLKNSITDVSREIDAGLATLRADQLQDSTTHYQGANKKYAFVQQNSTSLLFDELKHSAAIQASTDNTYRLTSISAAVTFSLIFVLLIIYVYRFARRLIVPLKRLAGVATGIAGGNLDTPIDDALLARPDEIGMLSQSFGLMLKRLKGNIVDLRNQKTIAEAAQAKDEAILASMADGVIATDQHGQVVLMNGIAEELFGAKPGDCIGQHITSLGTLTNEDNSPLLPAQHPVQLALQKGGKVTKTLGLAMGDNHKLSISMTSAPVMQHDTASGAPTVVGIITILRDITHEKEVDRMKTEFISLASHQLRTPLSAIRWFSEMLISGDAGELQPSQKDFATSIYDSTERMIDLVGSLLNISRMESGRIMIEPQPTDLKEMVDGLVTELQVKVKEREQTLTVSVHADLPKINLDPKLIRQVYLNLLTNAIKYTPKGGEISVFVSRKGEELISQVSDNGYGVPKTERGKMFQKFYRGTNITKIETDGTGLGLYLIKAIIEASHGKIWFESEEGKGTTFWFSLPMSGMVAKKGEVTLETKEA